MLFEILPIDARCGSVLHLKAPRFFIARIKLTLHRNSEEYESLLTYSLKLPVGTVEPGSNPARIC